MSDNKRKVIPTLDEVIQPGDIKDNEIVDEEIALFADSAADSVDDAFEDEFNQLSAGLKASDEAIALDTDSPLEDDLINVIDTDDETLQIETPELSPNETHDTIAFNNVDDEVVQLEAETPAETNSDGPGFYEVASLYEKVDDTINSVEVEADLTEADLTEEVNEKINADLADIIVAERFNKDEIEARSEDGEYNVAITETEPEREYDVATWGEPVVKLDAEADIESIDDDLSAEDVAAEAPAVVQDEIKLEQQADPEPVTATEHANVDISKLVDEITTQLMPEIEWKIRTRLRDILAEHFPNSD